ncbi:preprotein translocase subunit TatB [Nocardioides sp. Root190]|uniref:sulfurtransferase TusA family protein n=1 Tax=Nocardioides sp. Root190 TaxID=1736488 RepID=UPI0006F93C93|nr:sulfurtransferase TusA family protein [Nocardioides sp. Root190]KRB76023.1 preprotein translocase subunit TatB [Nocardioides sp. Root190]
MSDPGVEIDCRDLPCPRPIIELARALPDVPVGGRLAVVARDPAARYDVPAWCRMRGQEYVGEELTDDDVPRYVVRRLS